jgi:hypothetical protein
MRRKREVTPDDNFVPLVHTTPGAMDMHPDAPQRPNEAA